MHCRVIAFEGSQMHCRVIAFSDGGYTLKCPWRNYVWFIYFCNDLCLLHVNSVLYDWLRSCEDTIYMTSCVHNGPLILIVRLCVTPLPPLQVPLNEYFVWPHCSHFRSPSMSTLCDPAAPTSGPPQWVRVCKPETEQRSVPSECAGVLFLWMLINLFVAITCQCSA